MKKIKLILISTAIIFAVTTAFATRPCVTCEEQQQYYKWGTIYLSAGTYGTDYTCEGTIGICTYFKPNPAEPNGYVPCRTGTFTFVF